jgi:hypothetical protein
MDNQEIERYFLNIVNEDKNLSNGIAAIKTLLLVLEKTKCNQNYSHPHNHLIFKIIFSQHNSRISRHDKGGD